MAKSKRSKNRGNQPAGERSPLAAAPVAVLPFRPEQPPLRPTLEWLGLGLFAVIVLGFVLMRLGGTTAAGNEINGDRAIFTAINAATLTGFRVVGGIDQFAEGAISGPLAVLLLTLGGTYFALTTGGLLANRILRGTRTDGQILQAAGIVQGTVVIVGWILMLGGGRSVFDSLLLAAASFGNSGVVTGPPPGVDDPRTHLVLLPLTVIGGLGLPVLLDLYDLATSGKPLSVHSRTIVVLMTAIYFISAVVLLAMRSTFWETFISGLTNGGWTPTQAAILRHDIASSSAAAINARSAGLPLEYATAWPRGVQWAVLLLMLIGGNPASTAGGLKPTTLLHLFRGARSALAGKPVSRLAGIAATWTAGYGAIVLLGLFLLLAQSQDVPADRILYQCVSAASNAGIAHDQLSPGWPLVTLSLIMLLGRIVPMLILWWMAETTRDAELLVA